MLYEKTKVTIMKTLVKFLKTAITLYHLMNNHIIFIKLHILIL